MFKVDVVKNGLGMVSVETLVYEHTTPRLSYHKISFKEKNSKFKQEKPHTGRKKYQNIDSTHTLKHTATHTSVRGGFSHRNKYKRFKLPNIRNSKG